MTLRKAGGRLGSALLLCLLCTLATLDIAVFLRRDLWRTYAPDDYLERVDSCRRQAQDLVVVGGSTVVMGIDPVMLRGLQRKGKVLHRAFNLGLPGATTSEIWHAVRHGLVAPPRLLVYGITASDLNDNRNEPHGPRSLMDIVDLLVWVRSRPESAEWVTRHFVEERLARLWNLFYYRNGIRLWAADFAESLYPGISPEAATEAQANLRYTAEMRRDGGFAVPPHLKGNHRLDLLKAAPGFLDRSPALLHFFKNYRIGPAHLPYLHRLLDWAAAQGVEVVLLDMPVSADLEKYIYPNAFASYRANLSELQRRRGVPVIWATREAIGLEDADFADLIHLNGNGTARLSAWMRRVLTEETPQDLARRYKERSGRFPRT